MAETGRVQWARSGDSSIAYRVLGEGPVDIVFLPGVFSHIEVLLEEPGIQRWFSRLNRVGRVILMDRRGTGLSDPVTPGFPLDDEVADVDAVLDAIGCERAVLQAYGPGAPLAVTYAAERPERTLALILYAGMIAMTKDEDVTWALSPEEREAQLEMLTAGWGTGMNLDRMAPSAADDERMRQWLGRLERQSMTPRGLEIVSRNQATHDVRPKLAHIRVPTLVVHRTDDQLVDVRHSRLAAERIPGARLVELPGNDSLPMIGDTEALLGEILEFLSGGRAGHEPERALLTVLFTDVVGATQHAARMGDGRWRDTLAAHDAAVRRELQRYGGDEIKTVGDAFLVTFEGAPSRAFRCAVAIRDAVAELGIQVRAGLHTGECEVIGDDVGGMAVHIAARVCALATAGEILASGTAFGTVVGAGLSFDPRGSEELKGVPGKWPIFCLM